MRCKKCNRKLTINYNGYGRRCWSSLSKTKRWLVKWLR